MAIVIIPAYQPDHELEKIADQLWQCGNMTVVVDDGSGAAYQEIFEKIQDISVVLHHKENQGKGAAIRTALHYIHNEVWDQDVIGIMDADGQHLTEDMQKLLNEAARFPGALILGVRKFGKGVPLKSKVGNAMASALFYLITGKKVSDTQTGLRAFDMALAERFRHIPGDRYEYEMNMLTESCRTGIPVREVEIHTIYHDKRNSCSHFRPLQDAIRVLKAEVSGRRKMAGGVNHGKKVIMGHG